MVNIAGFFYLPRHLILKPPSLISPVMDLPKLYWVVYQGPFLLFQVGLKGQKPILEGQLTKSVQPEECLWSLDNSAVEMSLQKSDRMSWWSAIVEGEPAIDTSKVPFTHKILQRELSDVQ